MSYIARRFLRFYSQLALPSSAQKYSFVDLQKEQESNVGHQSFSQRNYSGYDQSTKMYIGVVLWEMVNGLGMGRMGTQHPQPCAFMQAWSLKEE